MVPIGRNVAACVADFTPWGTSAADSDALLAFGAAAAIARRAN